MAKFDLTADAWAEVVAAGGSAPQMIVIDIGEALVSIGTPNALTNALRLGGASGRNITDGRMMTVPAGAAVSLRPAGPRVVGYVGQGIALLTALALVFSNLEPLQFSDGQYLEFSA